MYVCKYIKVASTVLYTTILYVAITTLSFKKKYYSFKQDGFPADIWI